MHVYTSIDIDCYKCIVYTSVVCCAGCLQAKFTDIPVTDDHRVEAKASVQYKVMSYTVCSGHCTLCVSAVLCRGLKSHLRQHIFVKEAGFL